MSQEAFDRYRAFYVGVDLGQASDFTAVAVLEEPLYVGDEDYRQEFELWRYPQLEGKQGWVPPSSLNDYTASRLLSANLQGGRSAEVPLYLRHLHRYPTGTKYPDIVSGVSSMVGGEPFRAHAPKTLLLVDQTGVGRPVVDAFRAAGVRIFGVTITAGDKVHWKGPMAASVPKRDLVYAAVHLLQSRRLKIAKGLEHATLLEKELLNFRIKVNPQTAHDSYEHARSGDHDDLVLATSLGCWYRQVAMADLDRQLERRSQRRSEYARRP